MSSHPLKFEILARCSKTKARVSKLSLPHFVADTPTFMAVGTQGTMKGLTPEQIEEAGCQIILGNTYHLGHRPGPDLLDKVGGLHNFMKWNRALLTDSGGFQMVSLLKLAQITEEGVQFESPHDSSLMMMTPEHSIKLQNSIGADIIMQLDDVISSTTTGDRVEEAMHRSIRWLDRCIKAHARPHEQNLFSIIQGGLDSRLRKICVEEMVKRDTPGYAIGGLSGGESKDEFWRVVSLCTDLLPENKPRYCMGVGYAEDLVVCSALGVDMYDCVFPTRTARFGNALTFSGSLSLKQKQYTHDPLPIDKDCDCKTCKKYSRAYLHTVVAKDTVACHLVSVHNLRFQMKLMEKIRESILKDQFPDFVKSFMKTYYHKEQAYPQWIINALNSVNIVLEPF